MTTLEFEVKNSQNETLRARFICPDERQDKLPLVIMLTGDGPKGSKSLSWSNLPPRLLSHGIASLLFDFSGLGFSAGERKQLTLSKGISDFLAICNQLGSYDWIDWGRLGILASSFGAAVALACPEFINKAKALGLKSPCAFLPEAYYNELSVAEFGEWITDGYSEVNGYNKEVFDDPFKFDIYKFATGITTRTFITHGTADEVVPLSHSLFLKEKLAGQVDMKLFENGDHGYSGPHWEVMATDFEHFFSDTL